MGKIFVKCSCSFDWSFMNNLKRDPLEIHHPMFENSEIGLIKSTTYNVLFRFFALASMCYS